DAPLCVYLLRRSLLPVRQPGDEVSGIRWIDLVDMVEPWSGLAGVTRHDARCSVVVKTCHVRPLDPTAVDHQAALDQHGKAWNPRHLLDRPVLVEPPTGGDGDELAFDVLLPTMLVEHGHRRQPGIHACLCPRLPAGREDVDVARHIRDEVIERDTGTFRAGLGHLLSEAVLGAFSHDTSSGMTRSLKSAPTRV